MSGCRDQVKEEAIEEFIRDFQVGLFHCEKYHAEITKKSCVAKQARSTRKEIWGYGDPGCRDCAQGKQIKEEMEEINRQQTDSRDARPCVSTDKKEDTMDENVSARPGPSAAPVKTVKTCSICGKPKSYDDFRNRKKSEDGKAAQCRECISQKEKAYKKKARIRKTDEQAGSRDARPCVSTPVSAPISDTGVTIDFGGYPDMLARIEKEAADNFRTPDMQILYILANRGEI